MKKPAGIVPRRLHSRRSTMPKHRLLLLIIVAIGPFKVKIVIRRR